MEGFFIRDAVYWPICGTNVTSSINLALVLTQCRLRAPAQLSYGLPLHGLFSGYMVQGPINAESGRTMQRYIGHIIVFHSNLIPYESTIREISRRSTVAAKVPSTSK